MNFIIRGQGMEVTPSLKDFVEKKVGRFDRYFEEEVSSDVHVTMSVVKDVHTVEVTIPLPGVLLRAEDKSSDMYTSIDNVIEKLERQIRKYKTRLNRRARQEGSLKTLFKENMPSGQIHEEEDDFELVRTKRFNVKPMDVEEAILQMNMIGHSFFVFANADNSQLNVVYKRDDGRYGLIEPQS